MNELTHDDIRELIEQHRGKIFRATFIKRDRSLRVMICRTEVKKHLKGGPPAYDPKDHNLLWVFDVKAKGYRSINMDTLLELRVAGVTYTWPSRQALQAAAEERD